MDNETKLQIALDAIIDDQLEVTPAALGALVDGDLENFVTASTPGGIEAQEAAGQADFVQSQTLPIDCPQEQLETLGFMFEDAADDIFVNVKFPQGWHIEPTDHSMWSELVDPSGNVRAGIFYKAAFYDRHADMRLNRAIKIDQEYEIKNIIQYFVKKGEEILFATEIVRDIEPYSDEYWAEEKRLEKIAKDWMEKNYPDHDNVLAYWD